MVVRVSTQRFPTLEEFIFHFVSSYIGGTAYSMKMSFFGNAATRSTTQITPTPVGANYAHGLDAFLQSFGIIVSGIALNHSEWDRLLVHQSL